MPGQHLGRHPAFLGESRRAGRQVPVLDPPLSELVDLVIGNPQILGLLTIRLPRILSRKLCSWDAVDQQVY